jgi:hypothetical protein
LTQALDLAAQPPQLFVLAGQLAVARKEICCRLPLSTFNMPPPVTQQVGQDAQLARYLC